MRTRIALIGLMLAALSVVRPARAQVALGGTVTGIVVRAQGQTPVEAAAVRVEGTTIGVFTDSRGRFTLNITGLSGDTVPLVVRRLGFTSARRTVRAGSTDVRFELTETAIELDQVVTTGTVGNATARSIGNAVSEIDAPTVLRLSGAADLGNLLNGHAAGVAITPGAGVVGAGPSINIRGVSSVSLRTQPLLYIDGVRVANDITSGPQTQGGDIISRLNDINPQNIESIEIIKGPAASTIYGTEASNGVIQVITKHGVAGKPVFELQGRQGAAWFMNQTGRIPTNYALGPGGELQSFNGAKEEEARGVPLFRTGNQQGVSGSVSGGSPLIKYFIGADYDDDNGVDRNNAQRRIAGHSSVVYSATPRFDVGSSLILVRNKVDLGQNYGGGPLFDAMYGAPFFTASRGFFQAPPEAYHSGVFAQTQDLSRFTASVTLSHRPLDWLSHRLILGYDQANENNQGLVRFMPPAVAQYFPGAQSLGSNLVQQRNIQYTTIDYSATAAVPVTSWLSSSSSVGAQYYSRRTDSIDVNAAQFPGPGVSAISAAAVVHTDGDFVTNTTVGVFAQQQFSFRDRLFLTGAVRVDNNSAFGSDFKWVTYPKVSGSWVVSDESFWTLRAIDKFQLRAAYGVAGNQPPAFAALRTYSSTAGPLGQPAVTPNAPGNPHLQPERGQELEVGFTSSLFTRIGIDFTYYTRTTTNEILQRNEPPSLGFSGLEYFNAGKVYSHGLELQVTAQALRRRSVGLDLVGTLGTASNEIANFGGLQPTAVSSALPIQFNAQGYPLGSYFAQKVVSATLDSAGVAGNLMCDGGPTVGHRAVSCASAPAIFIGSPTPKITGSGGATLTLFGRLRLHGLVDFRTGYRLFDGDKFIRCDLFQICLENLRPKQFNPTYIAEVQNGSNFVTIDQFIEDASFAKLREISVSYSVPDVWAHAIRASQLSITLAARNLHTWTSYKGLDPETRTNFVDFIAFNQAVVPLPAQFLTTVNVTF